MRDSLPQFFTATGNVLRFLLYVKWFVYGVKDDLRKLSVNGKINYKKPFGRPFGYFCHLIFVE